MTKEFRLELRRYFLKYKKILNLPKSWKIRIDTKEKITEHAVVEYDYDKKLFQIYINPKLNTQKQELIDSILHELLHILLSPSTSRIELMLQKIRNKEKINYKQATAMLNKHEEDIVKKLAIILRKCTE